MRDTTTHISFRLTKDEMAVFKDVAARLGGLTLTSMIRLMVYTYAKENRLQTYMTLFPQAVPAKPEPPKPTPQRPQFPRAEMVTSCMKDETTARHISSLLDNPKQSLQELATQYRCDPYELSEDWNRYNLYKMQVEIFDGIYVSPTQAQTYSEDDDLSHLFDDED